MKSTFQILGLIGLSIPLLLGIFLLFAWYISQRTDCEQFNIDNIELRTGIDIPPVTEKVDCQSDGTIKTSSFIIEESVDLMAYLEKNKFEKNDSLYTVVGTNDGSEWNATVNSRTRVLNVRLVYK